MNGKPLHELLAEYEPERQAQLARDLARYDSPEEVAKRDARRREEHERGVRLGWWDADGNPLGDADQDDEDDAPDEDGQ